jgi:hypothetical protein
MGVISNDADEGVVTSLVIYNAALAAVLLVLGTPVYLLNMPAQSKNLGTAAYEAPRGTQLFPDRVARSVTLDSSLRARFSRNENRTPVN